MAYLWLKVAAHLIPQNAVATLLQVADHPFEAVNLHEAELLLLMCTLHFRVF